MSLSKMSPVALAFLVILLTGCPRDHYDLELTPRGNALERSLTFYREDGKGKDGSVNYQDFPPGRLAAITHCYPAGQTKQNGYRHIARSEFTGDLPGDVGGAGTWNYITTPLGSAAIYVERFRGQDDLAAHFAAKIAAADQLADLIVGWSEVAFGREPQYPELRRFLDREFRQDLKNFGFYLWFGELPNALVANGEAEFLVRLGQYLVERGYLTMGELPVVVSGIGMEDSSAALRLAQRLVATRLGISRNERIPATLAFLTDPEALGKSWVEYLATTKKYAAEVEEWERKRQGQPDLKKPEASGTGDGLLLTLIEPLRNDRNDHLVVRLALSAPPIHTNGKWDEARRQVWWESDLSREENAAHLPIFCYASWSEAAGSFQRQHLGDVVLTGEPLLQYCFWYASLDGPRAWEWDALLSSLRPDLDVYEKIDVFRFSGEPSKPEAKSERACPLASDFPRRLFKTAQDGRSDSGKK